jgi:tRNA pseudouridine55 synthase
MARRASPDGVLLLDKPAGITSTRALAKAKRLLGSLKGGHTGTLDPFATGLLPLVFGEATKFSRFLIDARKSYEAVLRLGEETETGDTESAISRRCEVHVAPGRIGEVLDLFRGGQAQVPPMHSAVRIDGRRLYEYARAGREVDRPARQVVIDELAETGRSGDDLIIRVTCSKGTYIRTLAQDIGRALGCGAHLVALRRTAVGPLSLAAAATLEELERDPEGARKRLLPTEVLVAGLARFDATPQESDDFVHGRAALC